MAIVCIAGTAAGIGKTAVAEFLLTQLPGWHAARVRVAEELGEADVAHLGDAPYLLLPAAQRRGDAEVGRLLAAGAREVDLLLAQPRGLAEGIDALTARLPDGANLLVEGNAYLWARQADVSIMVLGPGPSGKGLGRVRPSVRELFQKIDIWAWNTRGRPGEEGFFEFPMTLAGMGLGQIITNNADFHDVNPLEAAHSGNASFAACVQRTVERKRWRPGSDEFLRKAGFDV
jgi:hypothetical protein